jgi:hypothetical protein
MDVEDDYYGASWMEDALPQQMGLNHSLRVLVHRAEVAGQVRMMMTNNVASKWGESSDGIIECDSVAEVENGAKASEVPPIPTDMYTMCDRFEEGIDSTAGVSGVSSSGDTAAETKNARLVAYASQIDEQQNEQTLRNLQESELAVDKQQLQLFQQYVENERLVRIIGEDNSISSSYFKGAEIRGVDVRLETGPGAERTRAAQGKDAEERGAAGLMDPVQASELGVTGLPSTMDQAEQRNRIGALIQQAMAGMPVQADPTISPDVAVQQLRMAVEQMAPQGARVLMPLRSLLLEYMDLAKQGDQAMPTEPAQAQQRRPSQRPVGAEQNQLPSGGGM